MKQSFSSKLFLGKKREETELTQKMLIRNNVILLVALVFSLFVPRTSDTSLFVRFFSFVIITLIVYASSISLSFAKRVKNVIYPFSGITIIFLWADFSSDNDIISLVSYFLLISYFFLIGFAMIVHLIGEKKVKASTLLNAINTYLFLGYIFTFIFLFGEIVNRIVLGSSRFLVKFPEGITPTLHHYLYFSFVTLTTLGYGDITPITNFSQIMSVVIAVSGQIYMTLLLAFLVGRFLSEQKEDNN